MIITNAADADTFESVTGIKPKFARWLQCRLRMSCPKNDGAGVVGGADVFVVNFERIAGLDLDWLAFMELAATPLREKGNDYSNRE
jgi:hypothetical protein